MQTRKNPEKFSLFTAISAHDTLLLLGVVVRHRALTASEVVTLYFFLQVAMSIYAPRDTSVFLRIILLLTEFLLSDSIRLENLLIAAAEIEIIWSLQSTLFRSVREVTVR